VALTPAQKQKAYRDRQRETAATRLDTLEAALLGEVERAERGELSPDERWALAEKVADTAMRHFRRAQELSRLAQKVRAGARSPWATRDSG
jgi:hypothetical protein